MDTIVRRGFRRVEGPFSLAVVVFMILVFIVGVRVAAIAASVILLIGLGRGLRDASRRACPVHGDALVLREVECTYGLFRPPDGYSRALKSEFPFGGEAPRGGCLLPEKRARDTIRVCPRCETTRIAWWRAHGYDEVGGPADK